MHPSEQFHPLQQEVDEIAVEDAVFIVEIVGNIHPDDDLFEEVAGELQGIQFGGFLLRCPLGPGGEITGTGLCAVKQELIKNNPIDCKWKQETSLCSK